MSDERLNGQRSVVDVLEEINQRLREMQAMMATHGKSIDDKIQILRSMGFDWKMIGNSVGMNADAARMRFNTSRKKRPARDELPRRIKSILR